MIYLQLFLSFVQIGLFSFGGGYAALPLIQQQVVGLHGWLSMDAFADLIILSEMTPGPIALNAATFVGIQVAGFPGALLATFSIILPSCIIVSILSLLYRRYKTLEVMQGILSGIRPAIVAMIASAGLDILLVALWPNGYDPSRLSALHIPSACLFAASLFVLRKWKPNPIWILVGSGCAGAVLYLLGLA